MTERPMITTEEFDRRFDNGEDVDEYVDLEHPVIRKGRGYRRVNLTLPAWLIDELDAQAQHLAISRQAVAVTWLADRAKQEKRAM